MPEFGEKALNQSTPSQSNRGLSIACVIHSLAGGGAERVMAGLSSHLARRGHRVSLVTFCDGTGDRHSVDHSVNRVPLALTADATSRIGKIGQVRRRHAAIGDAITKLSPDVVLSFCDRTNIDVLAAVGNRDLPVVVNERSDPAQQSLGWFWNGVRRRLYRKAAAVVGLTEASARYLHTASRAVVVIPSAIDRPDRLSDRKETAAAKLIVGAGRLEHEKGFDRLLEAFAAASHRDREWRLAIYGEGSLRADLQRRANALGIEDRFELPGWVRPLAEPMSQATVFCLASRYEGFPSVLLEAMSMGVPVVSVDCESGPRAIIEHGLNGLLVEPSMEGLTEGLHRMIDDAAEREKLAQSGMAVVDRFSWQSMVDQYERLLIDVAHGERPVASTE